MPIIRDFQAFLIVAQMSKMPLEGQFCFAYSVVRTETEWTVAAIILSGIEIGRVMRK